MKWTKETKEMALELLNSGVSDKDIAEKVRMSKSSISLLKSKTTGSYAERIECEICGEKLKQITLKHLKKHSMTLLEYKEKFPNTPTRTEKRKQLAKQYRNPNKGKTYEDIYGVNEAKKKKEKISQSQIGRPAPSKAGTGITGTRKDTGLFARSTYEANIDRIFIFENKRPIGEFDSLNPRVNLQSPKGTISYQPDRLDIDGLFEKGAFLEIKGYMFPEDWGKICLFREQFPSKKLLVISDDKYYLDISYCELKKKYADKIPLWEDGYQNYNNRPDLYKVGYQTPEYIKKRQELYPNQIHKDITNVHEQFIAKKCISFNKVSKGVKVYVMDVKLMAISCHRKGSSRKSSGRYNYEMWEVKTENCGVFYIGNISKTTVFYCYESASKLEAFFEDNSNTTLVPGSKQEISYTCISSKLLESFNDLYVLEKLNNTLLHKGCEGIVIDCRIINSVKSKRGAFRDHEEWEVTVKHSSGKILTFLFSNVNNSTDSYFLSDVTNY